MKNTVLFRDALYSIRCKDGTFQMIEGIGEITDSIVLEVREKKEVLVNVEKKQLLNVYKKEMSEVEHNRVLDLSDEGDRWEGDVLCNKPFGWGVLYDKDNNVMYEGFRMKSMNVCYGIQYYADIHKIEYEGEWCGGNRWGKGVHYDRNGNVTYNGEWINSNHLETKVIWNEENLLLHNHIEELIIPNNCCNGKEWKTVDFSLIHNLRELRVGNKCFRHAVRINMEEMMSLERVVIGKQCFRGSSDYDRGFYLRKCDRIKELRVGTGSFCSIKECVIENNSRLEVIEFGDFEESMNSAYKSYLKIMSVLRWREMMDRLANLEIACVGY